MNITQDQIDVIVQRQSQSIEGRLYNQLNEIQEEVSLRKFDLLSKQLHLSAVKAQVSPARARGWWVVDCIGKDPHTIRDF